MNGKNYLQSNCIALEKIYDTRIICYCSTVLQDRGLQIQTREAANIHLLNKKGKTIIITTHYLHEAEELCDSIGIIDKGKLVACDTKENIKSLINKKKIMISYKPKNNFNISELKKMNLSVEYDENNISINYIPNDIEFDKILKKIQNSGVEIMDMKIKDSNLEDVFLKLTKT